MERVFGLFMISDLLCTEDVHDSFYDQIGRPHDALVRRGHVMNMSLLTAWNVANDSHLCCVYMTMQSLLTWDCFDVGMEHDAEYGCV